LDSILLVPRLEKELEGVSVAVSNSPRFIIKLYLATVISVNFEGCVLLTKTAYTLPARNVYMRGQRL